MPKNAKNDGDVTFTILPNGKKVTQFNREMSDDMKDFMAQAIAAFDPSRLDKGEIVSFEYKPRETKAQKFRRLLKGDAG